MESWKDSRAPALAEKLTNSDNAIDANIPSEFADLHLNDVEGEAVAVEDLAWLVPTNVYHNASAYTVPAADHPDTAALMVLAPYLRNGYFAQCHS